MNMLAIFIPLWGLINLLLALISFSKIKKNKTKVDFIWWWAFLSGAFVWEDMFVFGFLHALLAVFSIVIKNEIFWIVMFLVFWVVRSSGEALYQFLQQFIVPKHHPHDISGLLTPLRQLFGDISDQKSFIILQVFMQSITVICIAGLLYIFKYVTF